MSKTTTLIGSIQKDSLKNRSLQPHLMNLLSHLSTQKSIVFRNMNDKQKLSQIQSMIELELKNIDKKLMDHNIDLQAQQDDEIQVIQDKITNKKLISKGQQMQIQSAQQNDYQQIQQIQQQMQDQVNDQQVNDQQILPQQGQDQENSKGSQQQNDQQNQAFQDQDDVGLYGQQLNDSDQQMQDYGNQFDEQQFKEFQKQVGSYGAKDKSKKKLNQQDQQDQIEDQIQDNIEDDFDHYREIELDNAKQQVTKQALKQRSQMDNLIDRLEDKIIGNKQWTMKGQVKARQRPANSLLQYDLQFSSGIKYSHQITQQRNTQLQDIIKKRILGDMFDDRQRFTNSAAIRQHFGSLKEVSRDKSKLGLADLYQSQFKNFLGIGDNKNDKLKTQIMDSFKEINYYLDSLSNFSFTPKPTKQNTKKQQSEAIIVQQKVPLTLWNGQKTVQKSGKLTFQSQKEVDNKGKRLKNKRIARQRKKEQQKKKLNKKIQYGGTTKILAQAKQKALANSKPLKVDGSNVKFNKSADFFKNLNQNKSAKPNPNISKMKI